MRLTNRSFTSLSALGGSSRLGLAALQRRDLHHAAAGDLTRFRDNPSEMDKFGEPTAITTVETRAALLGRHPRLPELEVQAKKRGHAVVYGVDVTQLHNEKHPGTQELHRVARQNGIRLDPIEMHYLRSASKTESDDLALMTGALRSAEASGVKTVRLMHSLDKYNAGQYIAPSESTWAKAAAESMAYKVTQQRSARVRQQVESVLDSAGQLRQVTVNSAGFTDLELKS